MKLNNVQKIAVCNDMAIKKANVPVSLKISLHTIWRDVFRKRSNQSLQLGIRMCAILISG